MQIKAIQTISITLTKMHIVISIIIIIINILKAFVFQTYRLLNQKL